MRIESRCVLAPLVAAIAMVIPTSAVAAPNLFRHDLGLVNGHLRIAIEYAPEELGESLRTAEVVCRLGEKSASRQEADMASADWSTLGQLIDQPAAEERDRIEVAFRNAGSVLREVRERFVRRWAAAPTQLRELHRGVAETRRGIAVMEDVVAGLEAPFASWKAHECEAATLGVAKAFTPAPTALERINVGMLRLWRLANLPPPEPNGEEDDRRNDHGDAHAF